MYMSPVKNLELNSHLAELVLRQAGRLADEISGEVQNFKAYINCCI